MIWLAVGAGGALGSLARHGVNVLFALRKIAEDLRQPFESEVRILIFGCFHNTVGDQRENVSGFVPDASAHVTRACEQT